MRYVRIPRTDLTVSVLCLGTSPIGSRVPEAESLRLLDAFVAAGGTFIDTARAYAIWAPQGAGASETVIGRWLRDRGHADRLVVATKGGHPAWASIDTPRLSRAEVVEDCAMSRAALGLDSIPLYWLHRDDPVRPIADIFDTMELLRRRGDVRYYGFSNWSSARMAEALSYAADHGITGFVANQPMWSYAAINPAGIPDATSYAMDDAMLRLHRQTGLAAVAYTAQAKGLFSKWDRVGLDGLAPALRDAYDNERNRSRFEKVRRLSRQTGQSIAALSLAWLTSQPEFPVIPVVWAGNAAQMAEILPAGDLLLDAQALRELD